MAKVQKKHGKGRLDKYYRLAKEKGYRARAAFKLLQINQKYHFLEKSKVLIDLCAAPGSWCQVAAQIMPVSSLIVGVDLAPIRPIPKVSSFQGDITTSKCRSEIRRHLQTWKADTVLHDGAPNVGTAWIQDAYSQAELVLESLRLATDFLRPNGTFVTKVFRSKDYNSLMWVFNQLFNKVEATKPPSSRNVSAEIFVVCQGYKAPKKLDPKFLDPRTVFEELPDPTPNLEAKVFKPEQKKKRQRQGYEEGNYLLSKSCTAMTFINASDPISLLGTLTSIEFPDDEDTKRVKKMKETTKEVLLCCEDLRVLGKKDFRNLLRWRLQMRDVLGLSQPKDIPEEDQEKVEITQMDDEEIIDKELADMQAKEAAKKKRERRRNNERRQRELIRMQLNMTIPGDTGPDILANEPMFSLKSAEKGGVLSHLAKGRMSTVAQATATNDSEEEMSEADTVDEFDNLEADLDEMYQDYQERKAENNAKYRAKMARLDGDDNEWDGIQPNGESDGQSSGLEEESDEGSEPGELDALEVDVEAEELNKPGLSKRAALFFNQDIFRGIDGMQSVPSNSLRKNSEEEDDDADADLESDNLGKSDHEEDPVNDQVLPMEVDDDSHGIEFVKGHDEAWSDEDDDEQSNYVDIVTAEAMTLAQQLASGKKSKEDVVDDGFNRFSFRDKDGLPAWFLEDEEMHSKIQRPITAEAAQAIKQKLRALNARPIKKVAEAKARKKFKAAQKLEKLRKKSDFIAEGNALSEKDKAQSITKMLSKAAKKKPQVRPKLVVAKGTNKGIQGRPRGVKGRYKIVDARMKKEVRAMKRLKNRR